MNRRDALKVIGSALAGAGLSAVAGRRLAEGAREGGRTEEKKMTTARTPAIFAAHGNPMFMDDALFMRELHDWAQALPRPRAVLMLSAHWEEQPLTIGATRPVPLVYDFYGFPERYYQVRYPAPGAPSLAERVRGLMKSAGMSTAEAPARGLDHGAYVPMICMYPEADVPVLQVSLPSMNPQENFEVGRALAPLRDEGILIMGSGFLTHNLRLGLRSPGSPPPSWAKEFDDWVERAITRHDVDALLDYRRKAPGVQMALPTHEHFVPVLTAAGAASEGREKVTYPITGFMYGSFTKRSVQFG